MKAEGKAPIFFWFDKKSFSSTILSFTPHWDCKPDIEFTLTKVLNIITLDMVLRKRDCNDGSFVKGTRQPFAFSFALDKPPAFKFSLWTGDSTVYKK